MQVVIGIEPSVFRGVGLQVVQVRIQKAVPPVMVNIGKSENSNSESQTRDMISDYEYIHIIIHIMYVCNLIMLVEKQ